MRYLLLFIAALTLSVGCHNREKPTAIKPSVTINSSDMMVGAIGNNYRYEVKCTLLGPGDNLTLLADSDADWVTNIKCSMRKIEFTVTDNPEDSPREAKLTAHFGESSDCIFITQRPRADKEFCAHSIEGSEYYGKGEDGRYNYYVVLSNAGLASNGNLLEDSAYYIFDLYSTTDTYQNKSWRVPNGTYSLENGYIGAEYSYYCLTDSITSDDGSGVVLEEATFDEATLVVSNNGIEARITLDTGEVVNVWYNGTLKVDKYLSTLSESYKFDTHDAQFVGQRLGDLYNNDTYTTVLYIFDELNTGDNSYTGDIFQFYLTHTEPDSPLEGFYNIGIGNYRCIAGDVEHNGNDLEMTGSWYMKADMSSYAPLKSGSLEISKDGEEGYIFKLHFTDDRKNTIKGSYYATGKIVE